VPLSTSVLQPALRTTTRDGADIAVQSTHKTLGGLTQAAMLHATGPLVSPTRVAAALRTLQARLVIMPRCAALEVQSVVISADSCPGQARCRRLAVLDIHA